MNHEHKKNEGCVFVELPEEVQIQAKSSERLDES